MATLFIEEKTFDKVDFTQNPLEKGEYEYCIFKNCDFSNADLSGFVFLECEFTGCNLSLAKLTKTALRGIKFKDSKLLGLIFDSCNEFGLELTFNRCTLDHCSFYQVKLKKTTFKDSRIHQADFTEADLGGSVFDNCDLHRTTFENTLLEKADFTSAYNYTLDPELNRIRKAKFSMAGIAGLLAKYDIDIKG